MSEIPTNELPPTDRAQGGDEAFLVGAFAVGVHFLTGFFVAAAIFLIAMPIEPPVVRKTMLGLSVAFSLAGSILGTLVSPTRRPERNLGFTLLAAAVASLIFLMAVKFTVADPRLAKMAADTGSAVGFGTDTASFLLRIDAARIAAISVAIVGVSSLLWSRFKRAPK